MGAFCKGDHARVTSVTDANKLLTLGFITGRCAGAARGAPPGGIFAQWITLCMIWTP